MRCLDWLYHLYYFTSRWILKSKYRIVKFRNLLKTSKLKKSFFDNVLKSNNNYTIEQSNTVTIQDQNNNFFEELDNTQGSTLQDNEFNEESESFYELKKYSFSLQSL